MIDYIPILYYFRNLSHYLSTASLHMEMTPNANNPARIPQPAEDK